MERFFQNYTLIIFLIEAKDYKESTIKAFYVREQCPIELRMIILLKINI